MLNYEYPPPIPEKIIEVCSFPDFPEKINPPEKKPSVSDREIQPEGRFKSLKRKIHQQLTAGKEKLESILKKLDTSPSDSRHLSNSADKMNQEMLAKMTFFTKRYRIPVYLSHSSANSKNLESLSMSDDSTSMHSDQAKPNLELSSTSEKSSSMNIVEYFDIQSQDSQEIPLEKQTTLIVFNGGASDAVGSLNLARQLFDQSRLASQNNDGYKIVTRILVLPTLAGTARTKIPDPDHARQELSGEVLIQALQHLELPLTREENLLIFGYSAGARTATSFYEKLTEMIDSSKISMFFSEPVGLVPNPNINASIILKQLLAIKRVVDSRRKSSPSEVTSVYSTREQLNQLLETWVSGKYTGIKAMIRDVILGELDRKVKTWGKLFGLEPKEMAKIKVNVQKLAQASAFTENFHLPSPQKIALLTIDNSPYTNPHRDYLEKLTENISEVFSIPPKHFFITTTAVHNAGALPNKNPNPFQKAFEDLLAVSNS